MKKTFRLALVLAAFVPMLAAAQTASTAFQVGATVAKKCSVISPGATTLNFGAYDPAGAALTASLAINFHCTKGTTWSVTLDAGQNAGLGLSGSRAMAGGGDHLGYELYTDTTYAAGKVWAGNTTGGAGTFMTGAGTGGNTTDQVTVYGQLLAGQYVAPATYTDTVNFVVNY
jgi:spore coat protein U-like protein